MGLQCRPNGGFSLTPRRIIFDFSFIITEQNLVIIIIIVVDRRWLFQSNLNTRRTRSRRRPRHHGEREGASSKSVFFLVFRNSGRENVSQNVRAADCAKMKVLTLHVQLVLESTQASIEAQPPSRQFCLIGWEYRRSTVFFHVTTPAVKERIIGRYRYTLYEET